MKLIEQRIVVRKERIKAIKITTEFVDGKELFNQEKYEDVEIEQSRYGVEEYRYVVFIGDPTAYKYVEGQRYVAFQRKGNDVWLNLDYYVFNVNDGKFRRKGMIDFPYEYPEEHEYDREAEREREGKWWWCNDDLYETMIDRYMKMWNKKTSIVIKEPQMPKKLPIE